MTYTLIVTVILAYAASSEPAAVGFTTPFQTQELCEQAKATYLAEPMPPILVQNREKTISTSIQAICVQTANGNGNGNN